jgi:hypothetical protein
MAGSSQETILAAFNQAAGSNAGASGQAPAGLLSTSEQGLTDALTQATQAISAETEATSANTGALSLSSQSKGSGGSAASEAAGALNTASQFLGGGLTLMPLVSLFSSLFGGGGSQQPGPLTPYSLPPSLSLESTTDNQPVSWGENGLPRAAGGGGTSSGAQQITVQVQAMDSQSFLDRSDDIAQAVRQAMLNMNSLNDVVASL